MGGPAYDVYRRSAICPRIEFFDAGSLQTSRFWIPQYQWGVPALSEIAVPPDGRGVVFDFVRFGRADGVSTEDLESLYF